MPYDKILGQEIVYNDSIKVRVSGIVKDWNQNTDLPFTDFISFSTLYKSGDLKIPDLWTFVKLSNGIKPSSTNTQLDQYTKRYFNKDPLLKKIMYLQPLTDMHFNSHFYEDGFLKSHLPTIYSLIAIASFILMIAIVNFINLSTAKSIGRAKEMGVRKILGGNRAHLIFQFLTETFIQTFMATLIATLSVRPILTIFHDYIPTGIKFNPLNPSTIFFLFSFILIVTLLSGIYPAKVLSFYSPALSLKGIGLTKANERMTLRKGLIVFQFTLSLIFIIAVIVIRSQLQFIRNKDLGYNTDAVITIKTPWQDSLSKVNVLAEKIRRLPAVQKLALEAFPPIGPTGNLLDIRYKGKKEVSLMVGMDEGNENFIPLYQMKLLAGRNILQGDSLNELVLNESLSQKLEFTHPADAIGQFVYSGNRLIPIVGVVADYHTKTLHEVITPVCIGNIPQDQREIVLKLSTKGKQFSQLEVSLEKLQSFWAEIYPGIPFEYSFLDESIASMYAKEQKTSTLMNLAMVITVFISCMGLFGLILFSTEARTKEIGIRKVLGASVAGIVFLLSKDFLKLVFIAMLISSPVVYYFMHLWLQDYAYRIQITWWMFAIAWLSALFIAFITISFLAIKSALANPVTSLRSE
jgi:putative ABC transport system permease protein